MKSKSRTHTSSRN